MTREMIKLKEDEDLTGWELLHKFIPVGRLMFFVASQLAFQCSLSFIPEFEDSIYWRSPKGLGCPLKTRDCISEERVNITGSNRVNITRLAYSPT